ncbi:MAG: MmgE/PrpD family protein [Syntrophorhabdaceae bacterium]|nr:MmgE/PrpD family protein [Syntrophorhabdaceae bacterium]MDD5242696.1 MmgE/PrpD family protein [Syntrophorhabdaceae bacterium]
MGFTEGLARFVSECGSAGLPEDVVEAAKRCFLDWIGVTLAGADDPAVEILLGVVKDLGGKKQASILGYGIKTSMIQAALVNGTMAHTLDYDDAHSVVRTHPSAPLIPALLALAEHGRLPGRELIAAFVAGYEITIRMGYALGKEYYERGWHATAVLGRLGAAAGAARLLRLDPGQTAAALGLAATQAGGVRDVFGTMGKPLHSGKAAMDGLLAALLAKEGFAVPTDMLGERSGFAAVFSSEYNPIMTTHNKLGSTYEVLRNSFKPYAACLLVHPVIDGLLILREEHRLDPEAVESIRLEVAPLNMKVAGNPEPKDKVEAKFSLHFGAAIAIIKGNAGNSIFADETIFNPLVSRLMKRVTVAADTSLGEMEARVTVVLKDGTHCFKHVVAPKGDPANPLTFAELEEKFRDLTEKKIGVKQSNGIIDMITRLDGLGDIVPLVRLCSIRKKTKKVW